VANSSLHTKLLTGQSNAVHKGGAHLLLHAGMCVGRKLHFHITIHPHLLRQPHPTSVVETIEQACMLHV
jgi:hypothetical protein